MAGTFEQPEVMARCAAAVTRALTSDPAGVDLDGAIADVHLLPPDLPQTGALAAGLVIALLRLGPTTGPTAMRHLDGLLEIADRNPPLTAEWQQARSVARTLAMLHAGAERRLDDPYAALAELETLKAGASDQPAIQALFHSARSGLDYLRALQDGDESALMRMPADIEELRHITSGMPALDPAVDVLRKMADMVAAQRRGGDEMWTAIDELRTVTDGLPAGHPMREAMREAETMLDPFRGMSGTGTAARATDEQLAAMTALGAREDAGAEERALAYTGAGGATLHGGLETDLARLDLGLDWFRRAVALSPPGDPQRAYHVWSLALGLWRHHEVTGRFAELAEIERVLSEARELALGPAHALWSPINEMLAHVRRRIPTGSAAAGSGWMRPGAAWSGGPGAGGIGSGGPGAGAVRSDASPRGVALDGLRRHVWNVLRQSDDAAARLAVEGAVGDALDAAQQFLVEGAPADAVRALDAGRGLMLFAATELREVADRLDAAGLTELSRRWRAARGAGRRAVPPELRRDVLKALSEPTAGGGDFDPPGLAEIQEALRTLEIDALVYLVPARGSAPGWAVIAPVDGPASYMALTNLTPGDADVDRYLAALVSRDAGVRDLPAGSTSDTQTAFLRNLDSLCDWAWRAAIGPLLESYVSRHARIEPGRLPRLVLVPMGKLARIPWHAARRRDGTYAVELAAFSQAVSARMLCDSAAWAPVPLTPVGLIVGDPDTTVPDTAVPDIALLDAGLPDTAGPGRPPGGSSQAPALVAARREAQAVHQVFYRGGRYVGRRGDGTPSPSGAGTAQQVRDWLASSRPGAGAVLHLACHGFTMVADGTGDATSYLLLGGAQKLAAAEVVDLMTGAPDRAVGLVVLAACRTGLSIHGYDEAYSLGTAFLAGGARSVLSTQWSIPDGDTSVLMYMFHHYLMAERKPVWEALRCAQMWMLDPDRQVPPRMPTVLRDQLDEADPARVAAWAGFVHWGQ